MVHVVSHNLRSDIMLLDDPLSNLDSVVADNIMKSIVTDTSYKDCTFLISTTNIDHLKYCDRVLYV